MPNHKSSEKRIRQTARKTQENRVYNTRVKGLVKEVLGAVEANDKAVAMEKLPIAQKFLDRLAKKGVIKPNTAARRISRLASHVSKL